MLDSNDARLGTTTLSEAPPPADASRRSIVLGATAFLALALAGCSATGSGNSMAERRCVVMGPSGSRAKRIVRVPCETEGAQ